MVDPLHRPETGLQASTGGAAYASVLPHAAMKVAKMPLPALGQRETALQPNCNPPVVPCRGSPVSMLTSPHSSTYFLRACSEVPGMYCNGSEAAFGAPVACPGRRCGQQQTYTYPRQWERADRAGTGQGCANALLPSVQD